MVLLGRSLILAWVLMGILVARQCSALVPERPEKIEADSPEVLVYLDISRSFVDYLQEGEGRENVIELPPAFLEFLDQIELENSDAPVSSRNGIGDLGNIFMSGRFHFFVFSDEVPRVRLEDVLGDCQGRKGSMPLCAYLDGSIVKESRNWVTRLGSALEHAVDEAGKNQNRWHYAVVLTDLVDDCLKDHAARCLYYTRGYGAAKKKLSVLLRDRKNLEVVFYVGGTREPDEDLVRKSRNLLLRRISRDLGVRSHFVLSHDYEWNHVAFDEPSLLMSVDIGSVLEAAAQQPLFAEWDHEGIQVHLNRSIDVESIALFCDERLLQESIDFVVESAGIASGVKSKLDSIDRTEREGRRDSESLLSASKTASHQDLAKRAYRVKQSPCSLRRCRSDEELFLRVSSYNSLVAPIRLQRPSALCLDHVKVEVHEDPELTLSTIPREIFHSGDELKLEFDALLRGDESFELCFFDASHTSASKGTEVFGPSEMDGSKKVYGSSDEMYRRPEALARLRIRLDGERQDRCRRYGCLVAEVGLSLEDSLNLTTAKAPAVVAHILDAKSDGSLESRHDSTRQTAASVAAYGAGGGAASPSNYCEVDGAVERLAIALRPQPNAYLLLLLRVVGCILIIFLVLYPFRLVRRMPLLSSFAILLAIFPLLVEVQPHLLMKLLRADGLREWALPLLLSLFILVHSVLFVRAVWGDFPTFYGEGEERTLFERRWSQRRRIVVHFGALAFLSVLLWVARSDSYRSDIGTITCRPSLGENQTAVVPGRGELL